MIRDESHFVLTLTLIQLLSDIFIVLHLRRCRRSYRAMKRLLDIERVALSLMQSNERAIRYRVSSTDANI